MKRPLIKSLAEYLTTVFSITNEWTNKLGNEFLPWCRGHEDEKWELVPSIYRECNELLSEDSLLWDFRHRSIQFLSGVAPKPSDDLEWYFLMQHYGIPTRLLDWTESPLIALYFAVRDVDKIKCSSCDGGKRKVRIPTVWLLDPWQLNAFSNSMPQLFDSTESEIRGYIRNSDENTLPESPMAIRAPLHSPRIVAQRGVFTIHGRSKTPIESLESLGDKLVSISIDPEKISTIKLELYRSGISETSVFPELSSLSRDLIYYWGGA